MGHYSACQVPRVSPKAFPEAVHMSASGQRQEDRTLSLERLAPFSPAGEVVGGRDYGVLESLPRPGNANGRAVQEIIRMHIFITSYTPMLTPLQNGHNANVYHHQQIDRWTDECTKNKQENSVREQTEGQEETGSLGWGDSRAQACSPLPPASRMHTIPTRQGRGHAQHLCNGPHQVSA